jgi:hypothetical protein
MENSLDVNSHDVSIWCDLSILYDIFSGYSWDYSMILTVDEYFDLYIVS